MKKILALILSMAILLGSLSSLSVMVSAEGDVVCADGNCEFSEEFTIDIEPTCEENGSKSRHCINCGSKTDVTAIPSLGSHSFGDWVTITEVTCDTDGIKKRECANCGKVETETEEAFGHNYESYEYIVNPQNTKQYLKQDTCSICDSKKVNESPYIPIRSVDELWQINSNLTGNFVMLADIDLTEDTSETGDWSYNGQGWDCLGNNSDAFKGVFDGNGHSIIGLRITSGVPDAPVSGEKYFGLFAINEGVIKNLNMVDVNISGEYTISTSSSDPYASFPTGYSYIGAICGKNLGEIENCSSSGTITASSYYGWGTRNNSLSGKSYSYSKGVSCAGGVSGENLGIVYRCFNESELRKNDYFEDGTSASSTYYSSGVGGIVGRASNGSVVEECYSKRSGIISSKTSESIVKNSYSISGGIGTAKIYTSYYKSSTGGVFYDGKGTAYSLTDEQMKKQFVYTDFDFDNVWIIDTTTAYKYPQLRNLRQTTEVMPESIELTTLPKTDYYTDDVITAYGGILTVSYLDGTIGTVELTDSMLSKVDTSTVGVKTVQVTFHDVTTTYDIQVLERPVVGVKVKTQPTKNTFIRGTEFDFSGCEVEVYYYGNITKTVSISPDMTTGGDINTVGEQEIIVAIGGCSDTFKVRVIYPDTVKLTIESLPNKTEYIVEQEIEKDGLKVLAEFADGTTAYVDDYILSYETSVGEQTVTVQRDKATTTFTVTYIEKSVVSIAVTQMPNKTTYIVGDSFDKTGMVVVATYDNGTTEEIDGYTVSNLPKTPGVKNLMVTYNDKRATIQITLIEKKIVAIKVTEPNKNIYLLGEEFDPSGMVIIATYNNGNQEEFNDYIVEGFGDFIGVGVVTIVCDELSYDFIITMHDPEDSWIIEHEATCTEDGSKVIYCKECGDVARTQVIKSLGHDYDVKQAVSATCTENGLTEGKSCRRCNEVVSCQEVILAYGHDYLDEFIVDVKETCKTSGLKSRHCSRCDSKIDETVIPATNHDYSDWVVIEKVTCLENGKQQKSCQKCEEVIEEIIYATGHSFSDWYIETGSTCEDDGTRCRKCDACEETEVEVIKAQGHIYSLVWTTDETPTCTVAGSKSHHCNRCGDKADITEIPALGHVFGEWKELEKPSCTTNGQKYRKCSVCYSEDIEIIPAIEHDYCDWIIDAQADCENTGVRHRVCNTCKYLNEEVIKAYGHDFAQVFTIDKESSCSTSGMKSRHCSRCDSFTDETEILPLGHHYSSMWTIDKDPTCLTKGEKSHHCLRCDDKKDVEEIACSGHIFGAWEIVTEPTMDSEGMREHKCYNCDETETVAIAKLKRYTATFIADGDVVATVDFPEDATEIKLPEVPFKDKYVGEWENFDVRNKNFTVNAIYTPVYSESLDGITATNKTEYYPSTGEVEINLHAEAIEKTIVTTTKTAVPLDVVFVLDQSGSMEDGNKTEELKSAVTAFSNTILEDAKTNNVEHRIAIVGFASGSNNNFNYENTELLTAVTVKYNAVTDEDYKNALVKVNDNEKLNSIITKAIENIDAKGATKADLGLEMASNIFANNPVTDNRQRVVVFLTDGVPTSYSTFEFGVANAAILNAYQIKNTYDATIYSVGVFDRETSDNRNVNNFMNYVSSNYNEEKVLIKNNKETTPAAAGYYLDVSDVSKLSEVFTTIVEEAIIHTGEFDDVTLKYTLSKDFCLTSVQKEKLRKDAIELLEVSNNQISITENADGTTTVIIADIEPWSSGGKYVVDFTFRATANENTMKSGSYRAGTYDSGIMLNNSTEYEAVFAPELFDVIGTNSMAIFSINGEPYAIDRVSSTKMILAPDVDFGEDHEFSGWNVPENLTLKNECRIFDASLDKNEYVISWNINGQVTEQKYEVGSSITPPTVKGDEIEGMIFVGWDKEIPEAMPSENLTFTAVYNSHYHNYTITKEFETCDKGGTLTYTCVCGDSYDEQIEPTEHKYEAITGATENNTQHNVGFRCSVCGVQDDKKLELERTDTTQTSNSSHSTATYEFDYVDENGENCQPDGEVQISVQLDEVFNGDIPENAIATVYRVNDDGSRTKLESAQDGMNMTFETDHFSTYEFEFTTEVQKYMFAQIGSVIDTENKIIFSEKYVAKDYSNLVSYLAPATITSESNPYGFFGTGSSITFENNGVVEEYKVIIKGDLNGDSVCDVLDCMLAELIRTGNYEATQEQIYAANNDIAEEVDIYDFQNIINWALDR